MTRTASRPATAFDAETVQVDVGPAPDPARFPIIILLDAFAAYQRRPGPAARRRIQEALGFFVRRVAARGAYLEVDAEPMQPIAVGWGTLARRPKAGSPHRPIQLVAERGRLRLGSLWLDGAAEFPGDDVRALGRALQIAWSGEEARAVGEQMAALDVPLRSVAGFLSLDRVLQATVDRVRDLLGVRYAALATTDAEGLIDRFLTSGMTRAEREAVGELPRGHGLLGLVVRDGKVVRVDDIAAHPASHGFPPNHPPMKTLLGIPLVAKGRVLGDLYVTEKGNGRPFNDRDQQVLEIFAVHAAIAVENARLHEQVQRLVVVEERERIGRDLHDGIIQAIYGVGLSLEDVPELMVADPAGATARVDRAIESLNLVIRDIRNFIFGLRPELLEGVGLFGGLAALADEFRVNTMIDLELDLEGRADPELPEDTNLQLLHVVREALSNVARHSGGTRARIGVETTPTEVTIEVEDNGRGFEVDAPRSTGHQGLGNMRGRAASAGGRLEVLGGEGAGTRIIVTVPRDGGAQEETDS